MTTNSGGCGETILKLLGLSLSLALLVHLTLKHK